MCKRLWRQKMSAKKLALKIAESSIAWGIDSYVLNEKCLDGQNISKEDLIKALQKERWKYVKATKLIWAPKGWKPNRQ